VVADVKDDTFEKEVLKSKMPVVVDFWAEWCNPCRIFSPVLEEVSKEYAGKLKFFKMNADENEKTAAEYNVLSIPTVLFFEKGEVRAMSVGAISKPDLKKWLDSNL
jgi:thioredoxin 1